MKHLLFILSIFLVNCSNPSGTELNTCDVTITETNDLGGLEKFLICGRVNNAEYGSYIFTDIKYYSFPEALVSDTLKMRSLDNESIEHTEKNIDDYISVWVNYHDEALTYVIAR